MKPTTLSISLTSLFVLLSELLMPQVVGVAQSPVAAPLGLLAQSPKPPNPIVFENQKPGDTAWQYVDGGTQADDINQQIKGDASATRLNQGDAIDLKVSVNPAQAFTIKV